MAQHIDRQPLDDASSWIVTMGGIGLLPVMPGTWCSLVVALPALLLPAAWEYEVQVGYLVMAVLLWAVGQPAIRRIQNKWGHDPSIVVVDEAIGMCLILVLPHAYAQWYIWLGLVFLFRLFDVRKPWPISWFNNRTEPWAVIADDVVAAIFAVVVMHLWSLAIQTMGLAALGFTQ